MPAIKPPETAAPAKEKFDITCSGCGAVAKTTKTKKDGLRIPIFMGWKADPENNILCKNCWRDRYVFRTITFPVIGPQVEGDASPEKIREAWTELRRSLSEAWDRSTSLAAAAEHLLYTHDFAEIEKSGWKPGTEQKFPAMPNIDLYKLTKPLERGWAGAAIAAASLLRTISQTYSSQRYEIMTRRRALASFKYPYPYPVHNQAWTASWGVDGEHKVPLISVPISGRRWALRLKGSKQMYRQLAALEHVISGKAVPGELAIYRKRANPGDHRPGMSKSSPGGGPKQYYRVMLKLAAWLPRTPRRQETKTLPVSSKADSFLQALDGFTVHADHVRAWVIGHEIRLQRLADDTKFEKRLPKRRGRNAQEYRARICEKFRNRIKTFQEQTANSILKYALRSGFAGIDWNDTERRFFPRFDWSGFRKVLTCVAENLGAVVNFVTPEDAAPTEEVEGADAAEE